MIVAVQGFAQDGTLDATFNPASANGNIYCMIMDANGKILIGGTFTSYNGINRNRIARLNSDGTVDLTFDPGLGPSDPSTGASVREIAIQEDGKIVICGFFNQYAGVLRDRIARLNVDGSLDTSFVSAINVTDINTILIQPDNEILIGGEFFGYTLANHANNFTRLHADGSLDSSFNTQYGTNSLVYKSIWNAGKIIIVGHFVSYNSSSRPKIASVNLDGSVDLNFNPGTGATGQFPGGFYPNATSIGALAVQPDGKILIGGNFMFFNGIARSGFARLNGDGSLDQTFVVGTGVNDAVNSIIIDSNGKIVIGGSFTNYNGVSRYHIARLNSDGSLDGTFDPGTGTDGTILSLLRQSPESVIIGGTFTNYNGIQRAHIARINSSIPLAIDNFDSSGNGVNMFESNRVVQISSNYQNIRNVSAFDLSGRLLVEKKNILAPTTSVYCSGAEQLIVIEVSLESGLVISQKLFLGL